MDMIERVSEAIQKSVLDGCSIGGYDHGNFDPLAAARAAIEAMRELPGNPGPRYTAGEYSRRTQDAMVDDALTLATDK